MKKILIIFLIIALLACTGCKLHEEPPSVTPAPETAIPTINPTEVPETINYYNDFVTYVSTALDGENFIASPTSLRAALCLAIAGADEDTLDELLAGAGFNSKEDAIDWYKKLINIKDIFDNKIITSSIAPALGKEASFDIANSIWNNDSISQGFKQEYIDSVKELFNADVDSAEASELVAKINNWVNEKTHGMIPSVIDSVDDVCALLVNAIYLKVGWLDKFYPGLTFDDEFICKDGSKTTKTYMEDPYNKYKYYEDENTKLVIIPMDGDTAFVCVIGDTSNIDEKINNSKYEDVHIVIPKLDIESTFSREMMEFLSYRGVHTAFTPAANFNAMCKSENWYINKIMQKAKIKTDEDGLEAAAVTVITMEATGIMEEPTEIVDFIANESFSFFVYAGMSYSPEMLFFGQVSE